MDISEIIGFFIIAVAVFVIIVSSISLLLSENSIIKQRLDKLEKEVYNKK